MQIVGIFALVASIVFVGLQLKQSQEIAMSQAFQSRTDTNLAMYLASAENPMFVSATAKFYSGDAESMTPEELVVMRQYARVLLSSSENLHYQYVNGFISEERQRSGRDQFKRMLSGEMVPFPVRQIYVETKIIFLPEFQGYVDEILREIDGEKTSK